MTRIVAVVLGLVFGANASADPTEDLFDAISSGSAERVEAAIEAGADVNASDPDRGGPLDTAIHGIDDPLQCRHIVNLLLDAGSDPNMQREFGMTAMHSMLMSSIADPAPFDDELYISLVRAGGRIDSANKAGFTPFHLACQFETPDVLLLAAAASMGDLEKLKVSTHDGWTPGMIVATSNDPYWQTYFALEQARMLEDGHEGDENGEAEPDTRGAGMYGAMVANFGDGKNPAAKLWFLLRMGLCDPDAESDEGHTIHSLLEDRTDPEALLMKAMLELWKNDPDAVRIQPMDGQAQRSIPVPESLKEYFNKLRPD